MGTFEDRMFQFLEEWFQPIGERIEKLELELKGVKQQLKDILNRGPTKTAIETMLEKTIKKALKSEKIKKLQEEK